MIFGELISCMETWGY